MTNTILLDPNDNYVDTNGKLPSRDSIPYDKEFLKAFTLNQTVTQKGYDGLPPSMRKFLTVTDDIREITMAVTIPEISKYSDLLIVNRSTEVLENGKRFRLDDFKLLTKQGQLEIYTRV